MRTIKYTLLCEGYSEHFTLPTILNIIGKDEDILFIRSKLKIEQSASPSKSKVLKKASDFSKRSIIDNKEDVFIVGVDLDAPDHTDELEIWNKQKNEVLLQIEKSLQSKSLVFIPIQAFDYWLLYQKYKVDNSNQYSANSLESKSKKEIKQLLYGKSSPSEYEMNKICKLISPKIEIKELCKLSKSFNKFIFDFKQLIK